MKHFFGFTSGPLTLKRLAHASTINTLAVLWAGVIIYLAFSNLQLACVGFFSFTLSYLVGKYS